MYYSTDGTAGFSVSLHDAAVNVVWSTIVEEVLTANEWIDQLGGNSQAKI
jgi:hypothetical protein